MASISIFPCSVSDNTIIQLSLSYKRESPFSPYLIHSPWPSVLSLKQIKIWPYFFSVYTLLEFLISDEVEWTPDFCWLPRLSLFPVLFLSTVHYSLTCHLFSASLPSSLSFFYPIFSVSSFQNKFLSSSVLLLKLHESATHFFAHLIPLNSPRQLPNFTLLLLSAPQGSHYGTGIDNPLCLLQHFAF